MLARIIDAPVPATSSGETPLTDPPVPTGMKTGVSTLPWGVANVPVRAAPSMGVQGEVEHGWEAPPLLHRADPMILLFGRPGDVARRSGTGSRYGQTKEGQIQDEARKMKLQKRRTHRSPAWMTVALTACPILAILVILAARPAQASISAQLPAPVQDAPVVLVSIDWLTELLQDSSMVLLHVGMPTARSSGEFIPGARFLNYQEIRAGQRRPDCGGAPDR